MGDLIPVLLVAVGLVVAGVWLIGIGRRRDSNFWRFVGSVVVIVGLVAAVPSAIILALFFVWTLP